MHADDCVYPVERFFFVVEVLRNLVVLQRELQTEKVDIECSMGPLI